MVKQNGFEKKMRKHISPAKTHIVCIAVGILLVVPSLVPSVSPSYKHTFIALGVSVIAGALINLIITLKKEKDLNWLAFEQAYYECISIKDRIRHEQRIELFFDIIEIKNQKFMKLSTHHSFEYQNFTRFAKKYNVIKLLHDNHPPENCAENECPSGYSLTIGNTPVELITENAGAKTEIKVKDQDQTVIVLQSGQTVHIRYDIVNYYTLHDRLIWAFQEISSNTRLSFGFGHECNDMAIEGNYYITILHPEAHEIKKNHTIADAGQSVKKHKFIEESGKLDFSNANPPFEIEICNIILPFQGFEVVWNFKNYNE